MELETVFLCDFVRSEAGVSHVIAAGIDTVLAESVPIGRNIGLLIRLGIDDTDSGETAPITVHFQTEAGDSLSEINAEVNVKPREDPADDWPRHVGIGVNFGVFFPEYGRYSIVVSVGELPSWTLNLRVTPRPEP